jgi:hypothetical protein
VKLSLAIFFKTLHQEQRPMAVRSGKYYFAHSHNICRALSTGYPVKWASTASSIVPLVQCFYFMTKSMHIKEELSAEDLVIQAKTIKEKNNVSLQLFFK